MRLTFKRIICTVLLSCTAVLANAAPTQSIAPNGPLARSILQHYPQSDVSLAQKARIINGLQQVCSTYGITLFDQTSVAQCFTQISLHALQQAYAHCGNCGSGYVFIHNAADECVMC